MDCRNCFCEKTERQLSISEEEAKKIYLESREKLGKSSANNNISKNRDERKSLRRSMLASNFCLPDSRVSVSYNQPEQKETSMLFIRPVSESFQLHENKIQPQKYPSSSFVPGQRHCNNAAPARTDFHPPSQYILPVTTTIVNQRYPNTRNRKASIAGSCIQPSNFQTRHQLDLGGHQNYAVNMGQNYPNHSLTISQQFKEDLQKALIKKKTNLQQNQNQKDRVRKKSAFLTPDDASVEIMSSKLSRSPSGIRNINDIACTKTQSVGSSSSSEFSEIIFHQMPTQLKNIKKMTNSSINFAKDYENSSYLDIPENPGRSEKKDKVFNK